MTSRTRTPRLVSIRLIRVLVIAAVGVSTLAACSASPSASPTGSVVTPAPAARATAAPTITPTATPRPDAAARIVIHSHSITIETVDASPIIDIPFTTALPVAAAQIQDAIHLAPVVTPGDGSGSGCQGTSPIYTWGALKIEGGFPWMTSQDGAIWFVVATGPSTPNGIRLASVGNQVVGSATNDVIAALPGAPTQTLGSPDNLQILVDSQAADAWGTVLYGQAGLITEIAAPADFLYGHDCD